MIEYNPRAENHIDKIKNREFVICLDDDKICYYPILFCCIKILSKITNIINHLLQYTV